MNFAKRRLGCTAASAGLLRLLDHGFGADHDYDAAVGGGIARAIPRFVVADDRAFRELDVAVDNRAADAAVPADADVIKNNRLFDLAVAVHANIVAHDRL